MSTRPHPPLPHFHVSPAPLRTLGIKHHSPRSRAHAADRGPSTPLVCLNALYSSKCSGSCGEGRISRFVACRNLEGKVISDTQCDPAAKPLAVHPCGDKDCPAHWVEQEWDQVKPSPAPHPQPSFPPHPTGDGGHLAPLVEQSWTV